MTENDTHPCPVGRCVVLVGNHQLMCRKHWKLVPPATQREVYRSWDDGEGAGTVEHKQAMNTAIAVVNQKLSDR